MEMERNPTILDHSPTAPVLGISLLEEDRTVSLRSYSLMLLGTMVFFSLSLLVGHKITQMFSATYRSTDKKFAWLSYIMSFIHAPISGLFALYCFWSIDSSNTDNWFFGTTNSQVVTVLFTAGFILTDSFFLIVAPSQFRDYKSLVVHHLVVLTTYSIGVLWKPSIGLYFMCAFQIGELSNPFLTARWFLLECKMGASRFYIINGILIILTFFLCRVILGSVIIYRMVYYSPSFVWETTSLLVGLAGAIFFQLLQIYWFFFILRSSLSYIRKSKTGNYKQKGQ